MTKLTNKQKKFVETYLETGVGSVAARAAYDIPEENKSLAASVASENLTKPYIVEAIRKGQKDSQIEEAFQKLISLKRLDYFTFPLSMSNQEIEEHVEAQGITVLNIRESERGKLAFFAIPDGQALGKALDIWAKVAGAYAAEKHVNLNLNSEVNYEEVDPEIKRLAKQLNYGTTGET